jgi:hypothetical protein
MPFNPKGKATIKKLEGHNGTSDDAHARVDVNIAIEDVSCDVARAALGVDTTEEVQSAFFRSLSEDADQNSRFLGIKKITCNATWEGKHRIGIKGLRKIRVAKVSGVTLLPRGHATFDVTFNVGIEQPPAGYVDSLMVMMNKAVDIELEHDAELFDKNAADRKELADSYVPPSAKKPADIRTGKKVAKKAPAKKASKRPAKKAAPAKAA